MVVGRPVARPVALCGSGCWVGRDRRSLLLCSCTVVLVATTAFVVLCSLFLLLCSSVEVVATTAL